MKRIAALLLLVLVCGCATRISFSLLGFDSSSPDQILARAQLEKVKRLIFIAADGTQTIVELPPLDTNKAIPVSVLDKIVDAIKAILSTFKGDLQIVRADVEWKFYEKPIEGQIPATQFPSPYKTTTESWIEDVPVTHIPK